MTKDVDTRHPDSFVQFDIGITCGFVYDIEFVELQYSTDYGNQFQPVYANCYPGLSSGGCSQASYRRISRYFSAEFHEQRLVTAALPAAARWVLPRQQCVYTAYFVATLGIGSVNILTFSASAVLG